MKKNLLFLFATTLFLGGALSGFSQEMKRTGLSFRSLGMGGTGITTMSDTKTLSFNPAALVNIQQSFWDIAAVTVETNKAGYSFTDSLLNRDGNLVSYGDSTLDYLKFLQQYRGKNVHFFSRVETAYFMYLLDRGLVWGVNFSHEGDYNFVLNDDVPNTTSHVFLRNDQILEGGFSIPFGLGAYVLGIGVRSVERVEYNLIYSISDTTTDKKIPNLAGIPAIRATGFDVGFLYRMPHSSRLKIGIVGRNIGGLAFKKDDTEYTPIHQEFSAGISISPVIDRWTFKLALDVRDITFEYFKDDKDRDLIKRTHFGAEIGYVPINRTFNLFAFRVGLNQGHPSFGLEGNLGFQKNLILGYAYYFAEKGVRSGDDKEERNVLYVSLGF